MSPRHYRRDLCYSSLTPWKLQLSLIHESALDFCVVKTHPTVANLFSSNSPFFNTAKRFIFPVFSNNPLAPWKNLIKLQTLHYELLGPPLSDTSCSNSPAHIYHIVTLRSKIIAFVVVCFTCIPWVEILNDLFFPSAISVAQINSINAHAPVRAWCYLCQHRHKIASVVCFEGRGHLTKTCV